MSFISLDLDPESSDPWVRAMYLQRQIQSRERAVYARYEQAQKRMGETYGCLLKMLCLKFATHLMEWADYPWRLLSRFANLFC